MLGQIKVFTKVFFTYLLSLSGCAENSGAADAGADSGTSTPDYSYYLASVVVEAPGHTGQGTRNAANAVDGVHGAGLYTSNVTDVFSLGYEIDVDNYITLSWGGRTVTNGPGTDFVIFENPFYIGGGPESFIDAILVFLSRDGTTWVPYPHDYTNGDETDYSSLPTMWPGFAGLYPVLFNEDTNPTDPFEFDLSGGDHFDLDDLPDDGGEAEQIKENGFDFIKLVAAPSMVNPDTSEPFVKEQISNGADIDGVMGRYFDGQTDEKIFY